MRKLVALIAAGAVMAFSTTPAAAEYTRLKNGKQLQAVIGKRLYDGEGNWLRYNKNGTISGHLKSGKPYSGTWRIDNGYVCRTVKIGKDTNSDCQTIEIDGKNVRIAREKGFGKFRDLKMK